jgi:hypothetical protein
VLRVDELEQISYAAHVTGDTQAKARLNKLHVSAGRQQSEAASINAAVDEATRRHHCSSTDATSSHQSMRHQQRGGLNHEDQDEELDDGTTVAEGMTSAELLALAQEEGCCWRRHLHQAGEARRRGRRFLEPRSGAAARVRRRGRADAGGIDREAR